MGFAAVPVYDIYKAGAAPHWVDGLDLLAVLDLKVVVIPHYDNTEGGTHDTRYCYLGERRLAWLEQDLPGDAAVLGVDEHTAAVFDLAAGTVQISGRGGVMVRRAGVSVVLAAGTRTTLARLRDRARRGPEAAELTSIGTDPGAMAQPGGMAPDSTPDASRPPDLMEITSSAEQQFAAAAQDRNAPAMVQAILELEAAIGSWSADTEEDQGTIQARAVLRDLITRLGQAAAQSLREPGDGLGRAAALLERRAELRRSGLYQAADAIRDALTAARLQVMDTPSGTQWEHADADS